MKYSLPFTTLSLLGALVIALPAGAQVAGGTTTVGVSIVESTQLAMGWSVKKTLMGKSIYNDAGQKVGKVEDLIISPDKNVTYVIVGAGGFVGIGRHDVAIPVSQIKNENGKLLMPQATKASIKAMPAFDYSIDNTKRDAFIAAADKDIALGQAKVAELTKRSGLAQADAKAKIDAQIVTIQADLASAEAKLNELKKAEAKRWHAFEANVTAAIARLRQSL
jgi:hypothetical protein